MIARFDIARYHFLETAGTRGFSAWIKVVCSIRLLRRCQMNHAYWHFYLLRETDSLFVYYYRICNGQRLLGGEKPKCDLEEEIPLTFDSIGQGDKLKTKRFCAVFSLNSVKQIPSKHLFEAWPSFRGRRDGDSILIDYALDGEPDGELQRFRQALTDKQLPLPSKVLL